MAFNYVGRVGTTVPPFENQFLLTNAEAGALGEVFVLTSGRLTKSGATAVPEYIGIRTQDAEATSVTPYPVFKNADTIEFETTSTGQIATAGALYTIHTDGLQITTTTAGGVFKVTYTDGANPSTVRGFFPGA